MYGLLMDSRSIDRILSGQVCEFWSNRFVNRRGKMAFVDELSGKLRGFGNLENVSEMPYSEYYQYYGMKRYRWESVPMSNGTVKAYRYTFRDSYPVTEPRQIKWLIGRDEIMIIFDESELGPLKKQSSLFDFRCYKTCRLTNRSPFPL